MRLWRYLQSFGSKIMSGAHTVAAVIKNFAADVAEFAGYEEVANSWRDSAEENLRKAAKWKEKAEKYKRLGYLEDEAADIGKKRLPHQEYEQKGPDRKVVEDTIQKTKEMFGPNVGETLLNQSIRERIFKIRALALETAKIFDVDIKDVVFDFDMDCLGSYLPGSNFIKINPMYLCVNDPNVLKGVIGTVFHEMMHARQWEAAKLKKDYGYDDNTLVEYIWNLSNYIRPEWDDFSYRHQPMERDAYGIQNEIMSGL